LGLCVCDADYTAGVDMFDTRVLYDDATGLVYRIDCLGSNTGVTVVWSLVLVALGVRVAYCVFAIKQHMRAMPNRWRQWRTNRTTQFLVFDLLCVCPLLMVTCCLKLANNQQSAMGTEVAVTVTYVMGIFLNSVLWTEFEINKYSILVKSNMAGVAGTASEQAVRQNRRLNHVHLASYLFLCVIPTLIAFACNKALGPVQSLEWVTLLVRNLGVCVWQALSMVTEYLVVVQTKKLLLPSLSSSSSLGARNVTATAGSGPMQSSDPHPAQSSALKVVAYIQSVARTHFREHALALFLYSMFCIPVLWPYQTYTMALMTILVILEMNPGRFVTLSKRTAHDAMQNNNAIVMMSGGVSPVHRGFNSHQEASSTNAAASWGLAPTVHAEGGD
jgi:hypothetical protein